MPTPDESRLNDLKQRWARDPGSRLYLQLADEHRKLGQLEEAESVLAKGLENRPSDLSGLVALGRVELELDKLDEALEVLENVVGRDPTHIVANKLLLEVQLQKGDPVAAGERLEICRMLNDRDPELEHLEYRLRQLRDARPPAGPPDEEAGETPAGELPKLEDSEAQLPEMKAPAPEPAEPEASEPEASEPEASEPEASEPEAAEPPSSNGDEIFHLGGGPPPIPSLEPLWASPSAEEPFGGLAPMSTLAEGDVFRLPAAAAEAEPAPRDDSQRQEAEPPAADASEELTKPVAVRAAPPEVDAGRPVIHEELSAAAAEDDLLLDTQRTRFVPPEPVAGGEAEPGEDQSLEAPTGEDEPPEPPAPEAAEPVAPEPPGAGPAASAAAVPDTVTLETIGREPTAEAATPEPAAEDEEVATVALGALYLKQGHIDEAARIFAKVLERDPGNHAALAGLNLARRPKQGERLTAMDLLADRSLTGTIPAGLTAKKLLVLTNYLGQIRAGRERDDVR